MIKIDIISGFLGAGKTTLIKKLLEEAFQNEQVVLIENEFGEIGIDGGFLKEAGIEIREMNSGCICCSLVGDFGASLKEVAEKYHPDRILIEPSGVGKLSDVIKAVSDIQEETGLVLNSYTTVVDAKKCKMYMRNFGEFFNNQVEHAGAIILSRTDIVDEEKVQDAMQLLRKINEKAAVITTPIAKLDGKKLFEAMEHPVSLEQEMLEEEVCPECGHPHHHHEHHEECGHHHGDAGCREHHHGEKKECGHHHHHEHHEECGHHHGDAGCREHHHGEKKECGHHHHHEHHEECGHHHGDAGCREHHHGEKKECGHHHHHEHHEGCGHHHHEHHEGCGHHHHHHAEEVFTSWGHETVKKYTKDGIERILSCLSDSEDFGMILRAKGMLESEEGTWIYFDMVPGEIEIREGSPEYTGRFCVIGSNLKEEKLAQLFA